MSSTDWLQKSGKVEVIEQSKYKTNHSIDRIFHAFLGRVTLGVSPASLMLAYVDWLTHLQLVPAKQVKLVQKALRKFIRLSLYASRSGLEKDTEACIQPLARDKRFDDPAWKEWPFNLIYQSFLLNQQWWYNATTDVNGPEKPSATSYRRAPT